MLPKPLYRDRESARTGLCRPEAFSRGDAGDLKLFEGLAARVRAAPDAVTSAADLARACGVSRAKLEDLLRAHAHLTPAAWLRRERVRLASQRLLDTQERVVDVGFACGFASEPAFHRQFLALTRMTPGAYRSLHGAQIFELQLPPGYRAQEILAYHARDAESACEQVRDRRIFKALATPDGACVLEISLERVAAWCRVHCDRALGRASMRFLHRASLRMLGLTADVAGFETRAARDAHLAPLLARRRGLRLPLTPTVFEGMCWGIIGQQINIAFASALRREIVALAGEQVAGMRTHPSAARLADIDIAALRARRYSRSKADYLVGAARAVASGGLAIEAMPDGSAADAERRMTQLHGIGTWTARYVLMRGAGFADCAPVGDVALAAALQKLTAAEARPAAAEVEALMRPFAPHRSLATFHLWASLKDAA